MYYIYHIFGKKIGVTRNLNKRITAEQGYLPGEYEVLETSDDISYVSSREAELQLIYGYKIDRDSYKDLMINKTQKKKKTMELNVTEQTTTFPCPVNKLKGNLMDNLGLKIRTSFGTYILDKEFAAWIVENAKTSMFNISRCYVYNKAMSEFAKKQPGAIDLSNAHSGVPNNRINTTAINPNNKSLEEVFEAFQKAMQLAESMNKDEAPNVYDSIRQWASDRGIYKNGDAKTQFIKLQEETGELARAILKNDRAELIDAIGDAVVVLTNLAALEGLKIEDCVESAYGVIKSRQGSMVNGTFVKNTL
jgi:NTP pyrophosphatase (non-canonical NTP hydrolase)